MDRADEVVERALAAVAASKARRERYEYERKSAFQRIELAMLKKPTNIPRGVQMRLDLY